MNVLDIPLLYGLSQEHEDKAREAIAASPDGIGMIREYDSMKRDEKLHLCGNQHDLLLWIVDVGTTDCVLAWCSVCHKTYRFKMRSTAMGALGYRNLNHFCYSRAWPHRRHWQPSWPYTCGEGEVGCDELLIPFGRIRVGSANQLMMWCRGCRAFFMLSNGMLGRHITEEPWPTWPIHVTTLAIELAVPPWWFVRDLGNWTSRLHAWLGKKNAA